MKHLFTLLSLLLLLPVTAWGQTGEQDVHYIYYEWNDESQTFEPNNNGNADNAIVVTESVTTWNTGWYVVNRDVTIDSRVYVTGDVHLILANGCELTVTGGINVQDSDDDPDTPSPNSLTIYAQSTRDDMGTLVADATNNELSAGIGGDEKQSGGTITIHGGNVEATGSTNGGAGIGGGCSGAGNVTITGGTVKATGGNKGAGIGGGWNAAGSTITIHGGNVTATGGNDSAGIGSSGVLSSDDIITITGGMVIAEGDVGIGCYRNTTFTTNQDDKKGNAFIIASSEIGGDAISDDEDKSEWSGVIFLGNDGKVYDESVTLTTDATIPKGKTLVVDKDKTLVVGEGVTLTNEGTLTVYGELELIGKVVGSGSIPITGITLEPTTLSLDVDETATLQATITPSNATNQALTWSSSDSDVATVDANGNVIAVGAGTATITVEADGAKATCTVMVKQHTHSLTKTDYKAPTCTEDGNKEYWTCSVCGKYFSDEASTTEISLDETVIYATGHHYVNGTCTECGEKDPDYRPDPISYYNIYVEDVCDGVEVTTSKNVVREGGSISLYVEKDTANYTFDNFKVYYKRSYYGPWEVLEEGVQPGEYPIRNIWTHIYVKAEGAEEKEDPTGIEQVEGVKVYTKDGSLYVQTPQREQVLVITMTGVVVKNEEQVGLKQYHGLQPGIYVVRIGERAYKLRLH